ncbi:HAMP domain-containing protein [Nocardia sp. CA2R105]|uniref:ATP-binding protein n=1 Tax=Nocardia coffeae TaxID=2873381 RepID=UPI001CA6513A|nr:ATP-binding protein [Nocardia coffeae]MBY8857713.1 HAMP domain-containing protein [Nocardia coffeae]
MRDAARSGNKRWALSNWDLRWKVTAVLAVPLLVAVVLGASRIAAQFSDSSRLDAAVTHVGAIPAVTGLSGAEATVASEQMAQIAPGQSLVQDADLTALDNAITSAQKNSARLDGVPGGQAALDQMIAGAKEVRANGHTPSPTVTDAVNHEESIRQNSVRTTEQITATVSDPQVEQAKLRLVDTLNTRAVEVSEVAAISEALRGDSKGALRDFQIAANTERQMLSTLAHRFPDNDPTITALNQLVSKRIELAGSPQAAVGQIPVADLKQSLQDSLSYYQKIVDSSTSQITARVNQLADDARTGAIRYAIIVIATIMAALLLAVVIARSMIVPLRKLRLAALRVAEHDLGHEVSRLRDGASPEDVPLEPMPVHTDEEVGQLARAVDDIHGQALRLAADQASMRTQVNDMFETLARRSKSLVDHQLSLIEAMEYDEKDPRLLENLFRLDHLAARMRRNGDNLLILAGTRQRRGKSAPVEIADVLRAAISEVEDYERVKLGATPRGAITEPAASDLAHLFAELLDNALRASPPETDVKFTFAQAHDQGLLVEVADRGIGMPPAEMADINRRLETAAEVGPDTARHMGLFVVGRLAERHGLTVRLRPTFDTARDPGVTVTVHLPKPIIVAPVGGSIAVPTQATPQVPTPSQPIPVQPQSTTPAATMQTRAVTRTPSGNMMVTVDPGVSGAIPTDEDAEDGLSAEGVIGSTPPATASPSGGLPQRQPAGAAPSGLPQRQPGSATPGGLPQRQPGADGPTLRRATTDSGPGLPRREPGANGPQMPGAQPGANLPQRPNTGGGLAQPQANLAANMLKRQPGAAGQPRTGGLPQRQRGGNGAPQREPGAGGMPPREGGPGGLPQRGMGAAGLPRRGGPAGPDAPGGPTPPQGPGGLPERPAANRQPGPGGLPQREPGANGLPKRGPNGLPQRGGEGLPQRDAAGNGLPQRGPAGDGLPQRGPGGLPQRDAASDGPSQRDTAGNGLPQRDSAAPQRDTPGTGLPKRDPLSGDLPQRDAASNALPPRDPSAGGLPPRDGGLPRRQPGANGLPQRGPGGLPQRDAAGNGLPQRENTGNGLPQRDGNGLPKRESPGLPKRESTGNGLPKRDPLTGDLPKRDPLTGDLPKRDPLTGDLPKRDPLTDDLPQRDSIGNGLPQRDSAGTGLPRRSATPPGLPQRNSAETEPPQRDSGITGLPQRKPGAGLPPRPLPTPGLSLPPADRSAENTDKGEDLGEGRERGRHSFKSNPQKTAAFFQTRLQPTEDTQSSMADSPIFAEMMSAWLSDPNSDRSEVAAAFESPGDEGWEAARRAVETTSDKRTASGLPQRDPGNRLVPGGVDGKVDRVPRNRDADAIRSSLSRHQQGVRDGRAMKAMNLTGDKGDR